MSHRVKIAKPKKPLYIGDPNSLFTICYKKLRRHLARDLTTVFIEREPPEKSVAYFICKHCKTFPYDAEKLKAHEGT